MTDIITKCDRSLIQNGLGFLLQNVTVLLQNATVITNCDNFITKCDSYYKIRRLLQIATVHSIKAQAEVEHCGSIITEMLLPRPDVAHMTQMDADIVYYVTGFISKNVKKAVTCVACGNILEKNTALEINIEGMIPEDCQFFMDEINALSLVILYMQYAHLFGLLIYR